MEQKTFFILFHRIAFHVYLLISSWDHPASHSTKIYFTTFLLALLLSLSLVKWQSWSNFENCFLHHLSTTYSLSSAHTYPFDFSHAISIILAVYGMDFHGLYYHASIIISVPSCIILTLLYTNLVENEKNRQASVSGEWICGFLDKVLKSHRKWC